MGLWLADILSMGNKSHIKHNILEV